jgi:hypothetical protein
MEFIFYVNSFRSFHSSAGIAIFHGPGGGGYIPKQENVFFSHSVQAGSEAHPASYPMPLGLLPRKYNSVLTLKLTIHLYLVSRSGMMELYLHSSIRLYGLLCN